VTSIVLGDDHAVFAESLVAVLTAAGFTVPAVAYSLAGTIDAVREHRPQVCLLDRYFADGDAVPAIGDVLAANSGTRVLILTADGDTEAVLQAVRVGATGYVHKTWGVGALVEAVERVLKGEVVIDPPREIRRGPLRTDTHRLITLLTTREQECLTLLVEGLNTAAMAARLKVSSTTIRSHVQAILTKLGVHSRLEAAALAVRCDLVDHQSAGAAGRMA
jgi:DNA-binding NarL/FixJ family response regulator